LTLLARARPDDFIARGRRIDAVLAVGGPRALLQALRHPMDDVKAQAATALINLSGQLGGAAADAVVAAGGVKALCAMAKNTTNPAVHRTYAIQVLQNLVSPEFEAPGVRADNGLLARRVSVVAQGGVDVFVAVCAHPVDAAHLSLARLSLASISMRMTRVEPTRWGGIPDDVARDDERCGAVAAAPGALAALVAALNDSSARVAYAGASALSDIAWSIVTDADAMERADAIAAVPGAVPALFAALRRPEIDIASSAASALKNIVGGTGAAMAARRAAISANGGVARLLGAAQHPHAGLAEHALRCLQSMLEREAEDALLAARCDLVVSLRGVRVLAAAAVSGESKIQKQARALHCCRRTAGGTLTSTACPCEIDSFRRLIFPDMCTSVRIPTSPSDTPPPLSKLSSLVGDVGAAAPHHRRRRRHCRTSRRGR
jgi:hypothetical protein